MGAPPLTGLVVADFSRVLAGPLCTMQLADLGATVIKVERPLTGDDTRAWQPPASARGSTYFDSVNRSKLSVTLDLTDPTDAILARELADRADVLVENFRPGGLTELGLGYPAVSQTNPGIVYCSITGFGDDGGADRLGYDFVVQAVGGLMDITGEAGGEAMKAGVALVDVLTGKDATIATLGALAQRSRTGRGSHVKVNLLSSLLASLVNQGQAYVATGSVATRMGNRHPSIAPYEALRCRDGSLAIACGNDRQFTRLAEILGQPSLAVASDYATNEARVRNRARLIPQLEKLLASDDAHVWEERLHAAGVPAGKVGTIADGFALATRLGLAPIVSADDGTPLMRSPIHERDGLIGAPTAPPTLGAHNAAVRTWLGAARTMAAPRPGQTERH